jgi:tetratricopeptide (TPR) repeat protein
MIGNPFFPEQVNAQDEPSLSWRRQRRTAFFNPAWRNVSGMTSSTAGRTKACIVLLLVCLAILLTSWLPCVAQQTTTSPSALTEARIDTLQKELTDAGVDTSTVRMRRAYKNVARNGEDLLEASPAAPNRWRVLEIVFQARKRLLGLDNSVRNREALLEICAKLAEAPDEHAELRLEADLLLSEKALSAKGASLEERAKAIEAIIERYRNTPAEAKSLIMAAKIAPKLEAFELKKRVLDTLSERFAGDPGVIEFRRQQLGLGRMDVLFAGTYTRADGVVLRFPVDLMGRQSVMVFWSGKTKGYEAYLKMIKEHQDKLPGQLEVFSFNLDELPDSGAGTLRALQLDWTVMRLPGGKKSQAFRTYARIDPVGVLVNAYGHALLMPTTLSAAQQAELGVRGVALQMPTLNRRLDDARYLSQMQSLLVGDVLVTESDGHLDPAFPPELQMVPRNSGKEASAKLARTAESVPAETLEAIQGRFTPAPFRYRLATAEALANYEKAEKLCDEAVRQHPAAPDLWIVRNRRIIALLGMWNLAGEPRHLEQAAREAHASLAAELPPGADIVPRFCLAKEALREGDSEPESVILNLIEKTGGAEAPCSAHAAAAILALTANARDLHYHYSAKLLAAPDGGNPLLWSMVSFLRDPIYSYRLLKANYIHKEREPVRGYMINHGTPPMTRMLPTVTLKTLDGRTLSLPQDTNGKLTLLVFVEPSADPNAEFPIDIGAEGTDMKPRYHSMPRFACDLADKHVNKDVITIAAFLSDDADRIAALMKAREYTCQATMVPGGLANPMVRRLGVFSADRIPNVFLLRRDGSIAWHASGLPYEDSPEFVALLATKYQIETCEVETACRALEKGNFEEAARIFGGPYLPWNPDRFGWRGPRYHGQALAYIGLQDWNAALESIEKAIDAQKLRYYLERRSKDPTIWRKEAATVTINNPDDTMVELWAVKAEILDKLGRRDEAAEMRKRAAEPGRPDDPSPYKSTHERLKDWFKQYRMKTQKP